MTIHPHLTSHGSLTHSSPLPIHAGNHATGTPNAPPLTTDPSSNSTLHPTSSLSIPRCPKAFRLPTCVRIVEVGPRDGLQNESKTVETSVKIALVHDLVAAGLKCVEVTAFVRPDRVPQLADASAVMQGVKQNPDVSYPVLVPNMKGFEAAVAAGAKQVAVFASATESFSRENVNCSIDESLRRFHHVMEAAKAAHIRVRGYVSCAVGCPYEGVVPVENVAEVAWKLYDMGCFEISLGDTIGVGNPRSIVSMIEAVVKRGVPVANLAIHCHDTRGMALANVLAAMSMGVAVIDASVGGLGGCPFAPGAAGNLATEDLVYMLQGMGVSVGEVDLEKLVRVGKRICMHLGRNTESKVALASSRCLVRGGASLRESAT
eukprot:GFKZ01011503.1.p1 GENE.GFKZ01011503.1~~GFKZ01011503.1.p1  ORF type:complete len:375 (-),score=43.74 GFKZ01011503.1:1430-2554(-)